MKNPCDERNPIVKHASDKKLCREFLMPCAKFKEELADYLGRGLKHREFLEKRRKHPDA
jgi:hypothetical protein